MQARVQTSVPRAPACTCGALWALGGESQAAWGERPTPGARPPGLGALLVHTEGRRAASVSSPGVDGIMPTLPCSPCSSPRQTQSWASQSRNVGGGVFGALGSGVGQGPW